MMQVQLGAHIPWAQINTYLQQVLELGLVPEIAIKGPELDSIDPTQLRLISDQLAEKPVRPRIHAPFFDLNPGAIDPLVREISLKRLSQTLHFAQQLAADLVVIHPGVDKWRYPNLDDVWCDLAVESFRTLTEHAVTFDCRLAIENIYEETPDTLVKLVSEVASDSFGHCYDVGHWHLFGKRPMNEWLEKIGPRLLHLHLHDNHGRADEHLPVGDGTIDFSPLQAFLKQLSPKPSATLEAHSLEHLNRSLDRTNFLI
jgi:sugar phosphate isomerase/epimerase